MKLVFASKLTFSDIAEGCFFILLGLFGVVKFSLEITNDSKFGQITLIIFFIFLVIQGIRVAKTFLLYEEKLVVRRPLTLTTLTDIEFPTCEIKEVVFKRIKGRFGGQHILIKSRSKYISYRIECSNKEIKEFIEKLNSLNIKTTFDNWFVSTDNQKGSP